MGTARPLSDAFALARAASRPAGAGVGDGDEAGGASAADDGLEEILAAALARGRAAWPDVAVDGARFAAFLGERVAAPDLGAARLEDLFVACACADGDGRAIAALEARYFRDVDAALGKMGVSGDRAGEVKQRLRSALFVGDPAAGSRAKIAEYRGTGDLRAWLRVTAMRAALKLVRSAGREVSSSGDDAVLEARSAGDDPELQYMKAAYRAAFKQAFQEALDSLEPRERTLLKQQIVDGLSIDELGALYQVHRATAARWVQSAREKLLSRARRSFMQSARISSDECESIMRLVKSQLDVSLHRRLAGGPAA